MLCRDDGCLDIQSHSGLNIGILLIFCPRILRDTTAAMVFLSSVPHVYYALTASFAFGDNVCVDTDLTFCALRFQILLSSICVWHSLMLWNHGVIHCCIAQVTRMTYTDSTNFNGCSHKPSIAQCYAHTYICKSWAISQGFKDFSYGLSFAVMITLTLLLLSVLGAGYLMMYLFRTKRPLPPGPKGLPLLGNIFDVPEDKPWLTYQHWSREYGEFFLWFTRIC